MSYQGARDQMDRAKARLSKLADSARVAHAIGDQAGLRRLRRLTDRAVDMALAVGVSKEEILKAVRIT